MKRIILLILCAAFLAAVPVGFTSAAEDPIRVTPAVSIGNRFMIALRSDGTALAWGENQHGVFGNGTTEDSVTPQPVTMPVAANQAAVRFSSVCAGYDHVIALATDGTVWTWGSDANGQLGNRAVAETPQSVMLPKQVGGALEGKTVVSVAAGKAFSLALTSEGKVYAWGINQFGILGNLDQHVKAEYSICYPARVTALDAPFITAIFAGEQTAGALDSNGQVWLWGDNDRRQAGTSDVGEDRDMNVVAVPVQKQTATAYCARSIALGGDHTVVLMNDGKVASFGDQSYGQLGNGITKDEETAVFKYLPNGTTAMKMVAAGSEHSAAIGADGKVYVWGRNDSGILGTGLAEAVLNTPSEVTSELWGTPVAVFAGYDNTVVIDDQGLVYAWGSNSSGELGNGTRTESVEAPVRVCSSGGNVNLMLGVGSSDQIYHTQVTLNAVIPAPTFSVSIPSTVDVGALTQKKESDKDAVKVTAFEVKASNVGNLFGEKQIVVSLSAPNGEFLLKDEEFWLAYSVFSSELGGEALESGDIFAIFENDRTAKGRIEIDQSQITRRGSYTGSMRFTVSVADKEVAE